MTQPCRLRTNKGGGDVTDSDSELDTDQKCTACRGVFDYSKKADCVRFRCYECVALVSMSGAYCVRCAWWNTEPRKNTAVENG